MSEEKKLSKLGLLLQKRGMTQKELIDLIKTKFNIDFAKSHVSQHVNGKRTFMSTDTAKIYARALEVPMEDIC